MCVILLCAIPSHTIHLHPIPNPPFFPTPAHRHLTPEYENLLAAKIWRLSLPNSTNNLQCAPLLKCFRLFIFVTQMTKRSVLSVESKAVYLHVVLHTILLQQAIPRIYSVMLNHQDDPHRPPHLHAIQACCKVLHMCDAALPQTPSSCISFQLLPLPPHPSHTHLPCCSKQFHASIS